jgi:hypothetical protein
VASHDRFPPAPVALPERVTVRTCIGCGAMGRQERCDGECSEHKLVLVEAGDYDALLAATHAARAHVARLTPLVGRLRADRVDRALPDTVTGWWCARCGNVDLPQPCIGVCVWRPQDWVNVALFERQLALAEPVFHAARSLDRFLTRVAAVTPATGQWQRNWEALQAQARVALGATPETRWT